MLTLHLKSGTERASDFPILRQKDEKQVLRLAALAQDDKKGQAEGCQPRRRRLLASTQTELSAIAAAASQGESRMWKCG